MKCMENICWAIPIPSLFYRHMYAKFCTCTYQVYICIAMYIYSNIYEVRDHSYKTIVYVRICMETIIIIRLLLYNEDPIKLEPNMPGE